MINGSESFWLYKERPVNQAFQTLPFGKHTADVVIIGAGLSGLWTAYWLLKQRPDSSIVILEAERVGHGSSGRNGGWISSKPVGLKKQYLKTPGVTQNAVATLEKELIASVEKILGVFNEHEKDIDAAYDGFISVAHTKSEAARLEKQVRSDISTGSNPDWELELGTKAKTLLNVENIEAAAFTPHGAVVNPAKMVYALAEIVTSMGAVIYENSRVKSVAKNLVTLEDSTIDCKNSVVATEGYGQDLGGSKRWLTPIMSSMIITEPLPEDYWEAVNWNGRPGVSGSGHRYFYSQKTADNRIAFGGRGLPYKYGSRLDRNGEVSKWTVGLLNELLTESLGVPTSTKIEQAWCGMLGVPRDWTPSVSICKDTGKGVMGGYVGQGLPASYLAGATMADLILNKKSLYTSLPWTGRRSRNWEPEPLRFAGAYGVYGLYQIADAIEHRSQSPRTSRFAKLADFVGGR